MKRLLSLFIFCGIISVSTTSATAQVDYSYLKGNQPVTVEATVGSQGTFLTLSGYASPNASIVLLDSSRNVLRSVVADEDGNFIISDITVFAGTATYCFLTEDFRRLGESESCLEITATEGQTTLISGIFLPPTIGVLNDKINAGDEAIIYGYTIPGATVKLSIDGGPAITLVADSTGYYEYRTSDLSIGSHSFKAEGELNGEPSLETLTTAYVEALSIPAQIQDTIEDTVRRITETPKDPSKFPGWIFPLIALPLLALIAALLLALNPYWRDKVLAFLKRFLPFPAGLGWHWRKGNKMHHDWIIEFEREVREKDKKALEKALENERENSR